MCAGFVVEDVHDHIAVVENDPFPTSQTMNPPWTFIQRLRSCLFHRPGQRFNLRSAGRRGHNEGGRNGMRQGTQIQRDNVLGLDSFQALDHHVGEGFCRGRCDRIHPCFRSLKGTTFGGHLAVCTCEAPCQRMPNHDLATSPPLFRSEHQPMGHGMAEADLAAGASAVHHRSPNRRPRTTGPSLELRSRSRPLHELGHSRAGRMEPHLGQHARGLGCARSPLGSPSSQPVAKCDSCEMAQRCAGVARWRTPKGCGDFGRKCVAWQPMVHRCDRGGHQRRLEPAREKLSGGEFGRGVASGPHAQGVGLVARREHSWAASR